MTVRAEAGRGEKRRATAVSMLLAAAGAAGMIACGSGPGHAQSGAQTAPEPASLGFRVCNRTGGHVEVAKAVYLGTTGGPAADYLSEGWYQLENGKCITLWPGELKYRYYMIYAQNKTTGREWSGEFPVCVSRKPFTIRTASCGSDKYRRMFFQVDTGKNESWTHNLRP